MKKFFGSCFLGIFCLITMSACRDTTNILNNPADVKLITSNLDVSGVAIEAERIILDDYRGYYCVFFNVKGVGRDNFGMMMKKYTDSSSEKNHLYLHRVSYKELKNIAWGPLDGYANMDQFVGVWDKDYLVYIAFENGQVHGYFENLYSSEPGPGPFK